jgi:squalene cyclase
VITGLVLSGPARADVKMDGDTKQACERGLKWLAKKQNQDGSWSDGAYQHNTAITAFSLLAFMSQGHLPNKGQYSPEVTKGANFLIAAQRESDGYLIGSRGGNMYCHGMATLALAELWGSTGDNKIKPVLEKAIKLIEGSQYNNGGWRYDPKPTGHDISVTIMQVMALRAAYNAGLDVKKDTIDKAIKYIESCYDAPSGGFTYQPKNRNPGFARTAAGICVLYLTGRAQEYLKEGNDPKSGRPNLEKAVAYLKKKSGASQHYWYGVYYGAHAMYQYGQEKGREKEWENWYNALVRELVPKQIKVSNEEGYWHGHDVGQVYGTAISVIVLSVPTHYLPIFQR